MDRTITAEVEASAAAVHEVVADLTTYPRWLSLVSRVEPEPAGQAGSGPETNAAYVVTLRAKVGPLARNKRLRMERIADGDDGAVRFVRQEIDGRNHSRWEMTAAVEQLTDQRSSVSVRLVYDGRLWDGLLEPVLDRAVHDAVPRLEHLASN